MRKVDENQAQNYIKKHRNHKRWIAFALCVALITGSTTLYMLNKPATAMTEEGAESVGLVLETADTEYEQGLIEKMEEEEQAAGEEKASEGSEAAESEETSGELSEAAEGSEDAEGVEKEAAEGEEKETAEGEEKETSEEAELKDKEDAEGSEIKDKEKTDKDSEKETSEKDKKTDEKKDSKLNESEDEEKELEEDVVLTVSYVDENGEKVADEKELNIDSSIDFTSEAPSFEGYTYKEATLDGDVITKITVHKNADDIRYYEVELEDGDTKEIKKDATVVLTYIKDAVAIVLTASYVDAEGEEIADEKELAISESLDPKKDADAIEGYTFKEAKIDEDIVVLITAKEDEETGDKFFEATLEDESTVEIRENATVTFTYEVIDTTVVLTAKYVDKTGEEIQEAKELNIGDETELKKNQITEVEGYFFNKAIYEDKEITKIAPIFEEEKKDTDKDDDETETESEVEESVEETATVKTIGYKFTTINGEEIEITEDAEIEFSYLKASTETEFTYDDSKVSVKATVNGKNVFPEGIVLKATELTKDSEGYNYDAYMEALNENAEAIAQETGKEEVTEFTEDNTLMYDIAFMYEDKELQPAEGAVTISIEFKKNQLSNNLQVYNNEDVTILHLPIKEEVKEAVEFTSTEEATEITSADIEVKTLTDASTELSEVEKVKFEETSFSVFIIGSDGQKNTWDGKNPVELSHFSSIDSMFSHAVVANELIATHHIEGSIMVGVYDHTAAANLNNDGGKVTKNPINTIEINKQVINASDGEFEFAFFDSVTGEKIGQNFYITTTNNSGNKIIERGKDTQFSDIFDKLDSGRELYVYELYELDGSEQKVTNNSKNGIYTVTYSYSDVLRGEQSEVANNHDDNYIGEFRSNGYFEKESDYFGGDTVMNYIGQDWHEKKSNPGEHFYYFGNNSNFVFKGKNSEDTIEKHFTYVSGLKNSIKDKIDEASKLSVGLANAPNYPTKEQKVEDKTANVVNVINLKSTTNCLTSDLDAANFKYKEQKYAIERLIEQDQYLLINISVPNSKPYKLDKKNPFFDGVNPEDGYNALSSHVIYNFVGEVEPDGDNGIKTSAYKGTINIDGDSAGLLLAPEATVFQDSGAWNGEIIANIVHHSGREIHEKPIVSGKSVTVNITNTGDAAIDADLSLKKYLDGELSEEVFSFKVSVFNNNGWKALAEDVRNTDQGQISYKAENIGQYVITEGNDKVVYFLIKENKPSSKENKPSSNYVMDESYIIAKVTNLDNTPHTYEYYRVDKKEKEGEIAKNIKNYITESNLLSDNNADINKKIAFINESYKLTIRKEWKDQNRNLITDEAMTDTFSAVNLAVMRTYDGLTEPEEYTRVTLSTGNTPKKWEVTLKQVPRYTDSGKEYRYYIQELNSSNQGIAAGTVGVEYYRYTDVGGTKEDSSVLTGNFKDAMVTLSDNKEETLVLVCVNTRSMNVLPSTGGMGDIPYMATGLGTAVAGLVGAKAYNKKKNKDDEEE